MSTYEFNGVTYDDADLVGSDGRGYAQQKTTGTGKSVSLYVAPMVDALADLANAHKTTSSSSVTIGTGSKTFVLAEVIPLITGEYVMVVDTSSTSNWLYGQVTSWTSSTKTAVINVEVSKGSGTVSSWNFAGKVGVRGATGTTVLDINGLTEEPLIDLDDEMPFYDTSAADNRKISIDDLIVQMEVATRLFL